MSFLAERDTGDETQAAHVLQLGDRLLRHHDQLDALFNAAVAALERQGLSRREAQDRLLAEMRGRLA